MRQGFLPLIAVLGVAVLGGCSRGESPVAEGTTTSGTRAVPASCSLMQPGTNVRYLLCYSGTNDHGSFWFRGRGRIPISTPTEAPGGHWSGGFLAGDTLLAQWTAECEVPYAFFVPARGGTPRLVTGERSMENAPASIAHGWTISGEAIIEVIPNCSEAMPHAQSELWLISPSGERRHLRAHLSSRTLAEGRRRVTRSRRGTRSPPKLLDADVARLLGGSRSFRRFLGPKPPSDAFGYRVGKV